MPVYDVSAVAEAIGIDPKQLDNILSRNDLVGVERRTRGVARRLSTDAAVTIHLASELSTALRVPIAEALRLASELQRRADHAVAVGSFATLHVDVVALRAATVTRLDSAVELVGRRKRGRPARVRRNPANDGD
jgi:hypothetical protein